MPQLTNHRSLGSNVRRCLPGSYSSTRSAPTRLTPRPPTCVHPIMPYHTFDERLLCCCDLQVSAGLQPGIVKLYLQRQEACSNLTNSIHGNMHCNHSLLALVVSRNSGTSGLVLKSSIMRLRTAMVVPPSILHVGSKQERHA